ncbi:UH1BL protein, partial [Amia calva]|nr:UH1BL protein [Amia calva]
MLDLPTWLAINKVFCNKAVIRIPWTKLKTHPISLYLDKVVMEMSTCEEPRSPNGPSPIATASGQSEYGFAEKVVEGISLSVNSIVIRIKAKAFNASFELSQLKVYSVNTSWQLSDLRFTRIQDPQRGEILTFKEISWQMIRIEADAIQSGDHEILSAPVRLITNQSKIKVTLKRRMKDCNVVASKLILFLDDLLWVLTDSQLKAMVQYAKSLSEVMEKSAQQRKSMASESNQNPAPAPTSQQVRTQQTAAAADQNATNAKLFSSYDVQETSHHLQIKHLDLHICDDIHSKDRGIDKRITGGAMQLSFSEIAVDYYPFHRAGESCAHWLHYSEATKSRETWAKSLLEEFRANVEMLKNALKDQRIAASVPASSPPHSSPQHAPAGKISTTSTSTFSTPSQPPRTQLMSSSIVLRMADFSIYQVSTAEQRRSSPKSMISCNKKALYLPQEMPAIHIEFTEYYFPDGKDYPIPCPNLYVQLNALQLVLDSKSMVWLNQFVLDLMQSLEQFMTLYKLDDSEKPDEHIDIRMDGLMLKLVIPTEKELKGHPDLPRSISIQTSEMVASNTRHSSKCSRSSLEAVLQDFKEHQFFSKAFTSFPKSPDGFSILHPVFQRHAHEQDTKMHDIYKGYVTPTLSTNALKTSAATDLWAIHFSQFWIDYEGMKSGRGRPMPFVDSFPLSIWVCQPARYAQSQEHLYSASRPGFGIPKSESAELTSRLQRKRLLKDYYGADSDSVTNGIRKPHSLDSTPLSSESTSPPAEADLQALIHIQKHLSLQINHYQYVFLLRLQQSIKSLQQTMQEDIARSTTKHTEHAGHSNVCVGVLLKSAELALLLHPLPTPETGTKSPVSDNVSQIGSDISPSESRGNLESGSETFVGPEEVVAPVLCCTASVDDLLCNPCGNGSAQEPVPLQPTLDYIPKGPIEKPNAEDGAVASGRRASSEEKRDCMKPSEFLVDPFSIGAVNSRKPGAGDSFSEPGASKPDAALPSRDWNGGREKTPGARMPQSMSSHHSPVTERVSICVKARGFKSLFVFLCLSGRLIKERSQSSFSVSYKNLKKSPSLHSLDNISIDSNLLEEHMLENGISEDLSMAGFKDDQSLAESATDALGQENDGGMSPDAVSAASQSIEETNKDLVSVVVFKIFGAHCGLDMKGDSAAVYLQINELIPHQLGNVNFRQYISNPSMGSASAAASGPRKSTPEVKVRLESGPRASAHSPLAAQNGFLCCEVDHFTSDFLLSSLRNLGRFVEDDSVSQVLPMKVTISDTRINLKDDGPRQNPLDPEPAPITLLINGLLIQRRDDGSFSIGGEQTYGPGMKAEARAEDLSKVGHVPETRNRASSMSQATQTLPEKPSPPAQTPKLSPSNAVNTATLGNKQLIEENECLKLELSKAKMALAEAQMEKDSLLHKIKNLTTSS